MAERPRILVAPEVEGQLETATRVIELGNKYGHYTSIATIALDAFDPAPEGRETPELTLPDGNIIGGPALSVALESGLLAKQFQDLV